MRRLAKQLVSRIDKKIYGRVFALSVQRHMFHELMSVPVYSTREHLWEQCVADEIGWNSPLSYVEFGVYQGDSIRYFAEHSDHPNSRFIGLDSFEGLPEDWQDLPKGTFATSGSAPVIHDDRVQFVKGRFQDTWEMLCPLLSNAANLIVHYDADLYSSTLFALTKLDILKQSYLAIFDEFPGDETRALHDYLVSYNAHVQFLGKTTRAGAPLQVACRISPNLPAS